MGRNDLPYVSVLGTKGINQNRDNASLMEAYDLRNVWAPEGFIQCRPGMQGLWTFVTSPANALSDTVIAKRVSGTFSTTASWDNLAVGDAWVVGSSVSDAAGIYGVVAAAGEGNSNNSRFALYYWNGSDWAYLPSTEIADASETRANQDENGNHRFTRNGKNFNLNYTNGSDLEYGLIGFVNPSDWSTSNIPSGLTSNRYYLMGVVLNNAFDSTVTPYTASEWFYAGPSTSLSMRFMGVSKLRSRNLWFWLGRYFSQSETKFKFCLASATSVMLDNGILWNGESSSLVTQTVDANWDEANSPTVAVADFYDRVFVCYDRITYMLRAYDDVENNPIAKVEDSAALVGANGQYPPDQYVLKAAWPDANVIAWHDNRLFYADGVKLGWSAPLEAHRVFPEISFTLFTDSQDSSDIVSLTTFGEHLVVGKSNSIWLAVNQGVNTLGLTDYFSVKRIAGKGIAGAHTIQVINGIMYFAARDGLYGFDGTVTKKLTEARTKQGITYDRLDKFWSQIDRNSWGRAVSVHWEKNNCYLLSVRLGGDTCGANTNDLPQNQHVIVYDYNDDAFWIWSDVPAGSWVVDEKGDLFLMDYRGRIFSFDTSGTDHYTDIDWYIESQPIPFKAGRFVKGARIGIVGSNSMSTITAEILDDETGSSVPATVDFADWREEKLGSFLLGTDSMSSEATRTRALSFKKAGKICSLKLSGSGPCEIHDARMGLIARGRV